MPNLLDLPPEVFQEIIHQLVVAGPCNTWKLRRVCHTFAAEIQYDIFARQPRNILNKNYYKGVDIVLKKSWLYIFYRTKMPLDARKELPNKVLEMAHWLKDNATGTNLPADTGELIETVCKAIGASLGATGFRAVMGFNGRYSAAETIKDLEKGLRVSDKLAMAGILTDLPLMKKLLPQLTHGMRNWREHWQFDSVFGDILVNACRSGNVSVMNCLRNHIEASKGQQNTNYSVIVDYYFRNPWLSVLGAAFSAAIENGHTIILTTLLDMNKAYGTKLRKDIYNDWLEQSVMSGNADLVRIFMQIKGISQPRVLLSTFKRACLNKKPKVVSELLARGGMPVNDSFSNWTPLVAAIRLGNDEIVRVVLDAGAAVNGVRYRYDELIRPLQVAVFREDTAMIKTLLDRGASAKEVEVHGLLVRSVRDLIDDAIAQDEKRAPSQKEEG